MNEDAPQLMEDLKWMSPTTETASSHTWVWIAITGAALVLLAALFYWRYRRGKGVPFIAPPQPHVTAIRSLDDLESLLQEGNERAFTQAVSDIVRVYIQDRFTLRAPHRSTEEFLFEAANSGHLSDADQELLSDFLVQCDEVKFAKGSMVVDAMRAMLESAKQFVHGTAERQDTKPALAKAGA